MMFSLTALLCPLFVLAFIVVIIVLIVRNAGRAVSRTVAEAPRPPLSGAAQMADDGFWLSSFEPSAIVFYDYWAAGAKHSGQIAFQPGNDGRQFVYTGARPERVAIVRVVGSTDDVSMGGGQYADDVSATFLGAAATGAILEAVSSDAVEPPAPPSPPQFPAAY